MGQFKNVLSVVEINRNSFAVAIDKVPTGEVFSSRELATKRVAEIRAERKEKREVKK